MSRINTTSINCNKNKETKENKTTKRLRLTKTKLKDMLEYEQVKETIKRVSKIKEKSPNL